MLRRILKRLGYQKRPAYPPKREHFFDAYFASVGPDFFFVQIGASDGKLSDPIHPYIMKYRLSGVAVEPIPEVYQKLRATYKAHPGVACVNAAIAKHTGSVDLYVPENDTMASLVGTGKKITVLGLSFADFVTLTDIKHIDMLQIDCEGYDWEILKQVDLDTWHPAVINFEHILLSPEDKEASRRWLEQHGYKWFEAGMDTCAYKL